ncbi:Alpha/Beta hydrolase protein [Globomyces pollinis-pini]|nr:Alpha/Beta hydrolase protein [Globomyces pollinis-pini]
MDNQQIIQEGRKGSIIVFFVVLGQMFTKAFLNSILSFHFYGPVVQEWNLFYEVSVKMATAFMLALTENLGLPHLNSFQKITSIPSIVPLTGSVKPLKNPIFPNLAVVEHIKHHAPGDWPETANHLNHAIYAEWIYAPKCDHNYAIYMLHGGAYFAGSIQVNRRMAYFLSAQAKTPVFGINYRLAPQHMYPCAVIDAVSGYIKLLESHDPKKIVIVGDSAGGGLTLATLLVIRDMGLPLPGGGYTMSPWCDLANYFTNFFENHVSDYLPCVGTNVQDGQVHLYIRDKHARTPYASPYWSSSFHNLPPLLIQCGSAEKLYTEIKAFSKKAVKLGWNSVKMEVYKSHVHVFQAFEFTSASNVAMKRAGEWIRIVTRSPNKQDHHINQRVDLDFHGKITKRERV